jgi:hypothetical protein
MSNWLGASVLTLCAVVFLGLWIHSVLGIYDLEDQQDEQVGHIHPSSDSPTSRSTGSVLRVVFFVIGY